MLPGGGEALVFFVGEKSWGWCRVETMIFGNASVELSGKLRDG